MRYCSGGEITDGIVIREVAGVYLGSREEGQRCQAFELRGSFRRVDYRMKDASNPSKSFN